MGKSIDKEEVVSGGASGLCQGHQGEAAGVRSQESSQREVGVAQYLGTRGHLGGRVEGSIPGQKLLDEVGVQASWGGASLALVRAEQHLKRR